jgi:ribosomal protein S14
MLSRIKRNLLKQFNFTNTDKTIKHKIYKYISYKKEINPYLKMQSRLEILKTFHKKKYSTHQKLICLVNGRLRSNTKMLGITRMQIKKLGSLKLITGLRSSS